MASTCNHLRYKDKVALVTGGSKGIGEGIVREFVKAGAKVAFCARGVEVGKALEDEVNKAGPGECFFIKCDVQNEEEIKRTVEQTVDKYKRLDCLVNNAGWHPPEESIDDITVEHFKWLINFNLVSYFSFSKYALPHLRKNKGNIINISSLVAKIGQNSAVPYVTTKLNGRFGTLEESGKLCLFIAADATFCTGNDFLMSGGAELNFACKTQMKERSNIYE
ncbi:17-beta-hydroxysteroid dehydrogenase 14-like [Patiria miniata]|uniref:Uncharacterized protein n=1 Tax=Patiria miniata TaxID=46514 RepID=A0A913ZNZ3_PATMI|nr:17-beta-hydroxysteroid dehydrogenase 14-like [Patiria miniata]